MSGLCTLFIKFLVLITEETYMSYKAELVGQVYCNTWLKTYTEGINLFASKIFMNIAKTTIRLIRIDRVLLINLVSRSSIFGSKYRKKKQRNQLIPL